MNAITAVVYSFLFGILHGIIPDEHTWPIIFSYAISSGSGKGGLRSGLYFSIGFTTQRMIISELSYLALAPFLRSINQYIYLIVGIVMVAAGAFVLRKNRYPHLHILGHHHDNAKDMEHTPHILSRSCEPCQPVVTVLPVKWTLIHGFIAGFGFGSFALFINTVAAPAMPNAWLGFLPGLLFGLGTMLMLIIVGALFGVSLKLIGSLTEEDIRRVGSQTGGRTLFFGGLLFMVAGLITIVGIDKVIPIKSDYTVIAIFMIAIALPAFIYSYKEVVWAKRSSGKEVVGGRKD